MSNPLGAQLPLEIAGGVSRVRFDSQNKLLIAGWDDCKCRVVDPTTGQVLAEATGTAPLLDVCPLPGTQAVFSCADGNLFFWEYGSPAQPLATHESGAKAVEFIPELGVIAVSGWDSTLKFYDLRSSSPLKSYPLSDKALAMSYLAGQLVVYTAGSSITLVDIASLASGAEQSAFTVKESPLKGQQARAVLVLPGGAGYALCGAEGKVAVEPLAAGPLKPFSFKAHRQKAADGEEEAFPIHSACVHPFGTVATGGADGSVAVWDLMSQKRVSLVSGYPGGVTSLSFSKDGTALAIACGDNSVQGELAGQPPVHGTVFVRMVAESDVKPRAK